MTALEHALTTLRRDHSNRWPASTRGGAPHKPILLLALAQLVEEGLLREASLPLNGPLFAELSDCFAELWAALLPEHRPTLLNPLWHLQSDRIWFLHDHQGQACEGRSRPSGWAAFHQHVATGHLHAELFALMVDPLGREELRQLLVETYFDETGQLVLRVALERLREGRRYGQQLLDAARCAEAGVRYDQPLEIPPPVRDAGFRRAVRRAYDNRCATCALRVLTPDQRSLVQAAHIHAWAESYDDRPVNGLALCPTCHWCFDEDLLRIRPEDLRIVCARGLSEAGNVPAHLQALDGRPIVAPVEAAFGPDRDCLARRWG